MSVYTKARAALGMGARLVREPRFRNAYMQISKMLYHEPFLVQGVPRLADSLESKPELTGVFAAIADGFDQQPPTGQAQLLRLPVVLRGLDYTRTWTSPLVGEGEVAPSEARPLPGALRSYFDAHKEGKGIWKWNHYFDVYERHLGKFVGRDLNLLEIGIYSGGSLDMWRAYFGPKSQMYGVDIQEACREYENEYTHVFIGDQADRGFWRSFRQQVPRIDVLIDDGGHEPEQQIVTLEEMLPYLSPGGVYVCEDIHGIHNAFSSYLHGLVEALNDMHGSALKGVEAAPFQRWIKSISFYPYIVVIEKADAPVDRYSAPMHGTQWQPFGDRWRRATS